MKQSQLSRIELLLLTISLVVVVLYFNSVSRNSLGFFVDEDSIAYNAHTISQNGVDESSQTFPLYFRALANTRTRSTYIFWQPSSGSLGRAFLQPEC